MITSEGTISHQLSKNRPPFREKKSPKGFPLWKMVSHYDYGDGW